MNIRVIRHIVAEIGHRRWVKRRKPDCIDPQGITEIIEFFDNSLQIANTISGCIFKAAGIDLVNNRCLPPGMSM
jgi:hypothetical protein